MSEEQDVLRRQTVASGVVALASATGGAGRPLRSCARNAPSPTPRPPWAARAISRACRPPAGVRERRLHSGGARLVEERRHDRGPARAGARGASRRGSAARRRRVRCVNTDLARTRSAVAVSRPGSGNSSTGWPRERSRRARRSARSRREARLRGPAPPAPADRGRVHVEPDVAPVRRKPPRGAPRPSRPAPQPTSRTSPRVVQRAQPVQERRRSRARRSRRRRRSRYGGEARAAEDGGGRWRAARRGRAGSRASSAERADGAQRVPDHRRGRSAAGDPRREEARSPRRRSDSARRR